MKRKIRNTLDYVWIIALFALLLLFALYPNLLALGLLGIGGYLIFRFKIFPKPRREYADEHYYPKDQMAKGSAITGRLFPQNLSSGGEILIVTGECSSGFYKYFLQYSLDVSRERNAVIKVITSSPIHSQDGDEEFDPHDIEKIKSKSPVLYNAIKDGMLRLFLLPDYPIRHYGVVDDTTIYLQEPHEHTQDKAQYMKQESIHLAKKYRRKFEELLVEATEVTIPEV